MSMSFPNESPDYREARDHLLTQEIELRRTMESVAVALRSLPLGGVIPDDYAFTGLDANGSPTTIHMSELFADGKDSLVLYNFMYSPAMDSPCPSCSAFIDSLDGAAKHVEQRINFAIVAESPLPRILEAATERGWTHTRFLSSHNTTFKRDYHGETADGDQMPILNVFHRHNGQIHHYWSSELMGSPADPRPRLASQRHPRSPLEHLRPHPRRPRHRLEPPTHLPHVLTPPTIHRTSPTP